MKNIMSDKLKKLKQGLIKSLTQGFKGTLEYYFNPQAHLFFGYYLIALLCVPIALFVSLWSGLVIIIGIPFMASAIWGADQPERSFTVYNKLKNKVTTIYKEIFKGA